MGHPSWPVVIGGLASAGASGYRLAWGGRRAETNGYGGISYGMLCSGLHTCLRGAVGTRSANLWTSCRTPSSDCICQKGPPSGGRRAETNGYGGISYGMLCSGFTMLRRSGDTIGKLVDVLPDSK